MQLLTKAEVCEMLQISQATLQRIVANGELRQTKIGRQCRYDKADVERFVLLNTSHERKTPRRPVPKPEKMPECGYYPYMKVV